jgi:hypothetical protein
MASAGRGMPPTIESSENRTEADANAGGSLPVGGQDMGATADAGGRNKTKGAQVAQEGALQQQGEAHRAVHPQNVRFQNVRFQNVWFQNVQFQNVRFTKHQVYKTSGFKASGFKTSNF